MGTNQPTTFGPYGGMPSMYGSYGGGMPAMYGSYGGAVPVSEYPGAGVQQAMPTHMYSTYSQPVPQPVQYTQPSVSYTTQEIQQPRTYMEEVTKTIQVPKTVMEDHDVEYQVPQVEMETRTIQVSASFAVQTALSVRVIMLRVRFCRSQRLLWRTRRSLCRSRAPSRCR